VRTFLFYRLNLYGKGLTYINYGGTIIYINYITYIYYTTNVKECDPMRIVAVANQKGGVGKTTTSQALTAGLADKGYKVLGIDLDPQGNLSSACGSVNYNVPTIYELMKREVTAEETIQHMNGGYDIIPSNIMLAGAEQELSQTGKEHRLKEAIAAVSDNYDYIIVDTPPSLGVLTVNAFTAASDILIPTTAGIFATTGINQLNETVKSVQKYCNPNVKITGILFTRFNPRANISKQIKELTEQLSQYISAPIYKTYIRSAVAVEEAQANRVDIFDFAEKSTVSEDYKAFIEEFLKGEQE
jgi:chromosome partitioning protein